MSDGPVRATVSRHDFQAAAVRQPTAKVFNGVCAVDADDLGRGVADKPVHQNEALFVLRPAGLCFVDPLVGRIRFCHS